MSFKAYSTFRLARSTLLAGSMLAVGALWYTPPAFAQTADAAQPSLTLQGARQSNYSRLILDVPASVNVDAAVDGRVLTITLAGNYAVDTSALADVRLVAVGGANVQRSATQTLVQLDVVPGLDVRHFRSGGFLVIDLYGGDLNAGIQNNVATQSPSNSVAASRANQPSAPGNAGQDASTAVANAGTADADTASAENSQTSNNEAQQLPGVPPSGQPDAGNSSELSGSVSQGANAGPTNTSGAQRDDEDDGTGLKTLLAAGAARDAENELEAAENKPSVDDAASTTGTSKLMSVSNTEDDDEPIVEGPGFGELPDADTAGLQNSQTTDIDNSFGEQTSAIEFTNMQAAEDLSKRITIETRDITQGVELAFQLPETAAAAVFERGNSLWIVFDKPLQLDPTGLRAGGREILRRIRRVEQLPNADALILRLNVRGGQYYAMERDDDTWRIALKDTPAKPRFPLRPTRREEDSGAQQIFVQAGDVGRKIEFEDPDVGDLLFVLPILRESNGVAQQYNYASAQLLETAQGIAVSPLTDNVNVERFRDGIAISSYGNGLLSASQLARGSGVGNNSGNAFSRLIDFQEWRIGPRNEYRRNKARLLYELSLASPDTANDVRWKIARYFLAHGRAAEALAILENMLKDDEVLERNSEFRAVRGVANFRQGRLIEAETDLAVPELSAEQDAELWRALVAESLSKYEDALEYYRRGRDIMGIHDEYDRIELLLAVVRAAIETGDLELAQQELDQIAVLTPTDRQLSESVYQSARIAERQGRFDQAQVQYEDLAQSPERWISARARYSLTKFGLANGELTTEDGIESLERLRYAWRGDAFESLLLGDLADLYLQNRQYEAGLETLRQAVSYYPRQAREKGLSSRMATVFKDLFLEGGADTMSPIEAIGLFYDFRELTPLGSEGDLMIRRLADRLVSVDLLDRAASLLEYQVTSRTQGAARAQIAANLAKIYILNREPTKALEIIRATREPRLPDDIMATRRHVETRALVEMGRFEEAEVLVEDDRSADAEVLRADIFWGAKNWPYLVTSVRRLLGEGWRRNEPITGLQRLNLMRLAIAMSFTSDRAGLIELRRRYANQMRDGDFALAFDLLTNDQELSGRELGAIATQIASVEKFQSFMRDYRNDFTGR